MGAVGEDGIDATHFEIAEVVHVVLIDADVEAAELFEEAMGGGGGEDTDGAAAKGVEGLEGGIGDATDELLAEGEVGAGHVDLAEVFGGPFESGDGDVEIAALAEGGEEHVPVVLDELVPHAETAGEVRCELDFKTDESVGVVVRMEDVGGAAFGIVAPTKDPAGLDISPGIGAGMGLGEEKEQDADGLEEAVRSEETGWGQRVCRQDDHGC